MCLIGGFCVSQVLKKDLGDAAESEGKSFDFLFFKDLEESVRDDLKIIKESPLIPNEITVFGFIYDVSPPSLFSTQQESMP